MITNDVKACFENYPELNLIPEDKVSIIKKNLAKDHRTEADWTTIKDILGSFNLIICGLDEPDKKIKTTENNRQQRNTGKTGSFPFTVPWSGRCLRQRVFSQGWRCRIYALLRK